MIDKHQHQTKTLDSMQTQEEESEQLESESSDVDAEVAFTMQMINQKIKGKEKQTQLADLAPENNVNKTKFNKFQMKPYPYSIVLSDPEKRIISLFCFTLSLSWEQWDKLRKD